MCQGGCPQGSGTGGPGYRFKDELPQSGQYQIGSLAMANAGPNTNGSQFFIVSGPSGVGLPPSYSLFGKVVGGLEIVNAMQSVRTGPGDRPLDDVVIESVTITVSAASMRLPSLMATGIVFTLSPAAKVSVPPASV